MPDSHSSLPSSALRAGFEYSRKKYIDVFLPSLLPSGESLIIIAILLHCLMRCSNIAALSHEVP